MNYSLFQPSFYRCSTVTFQQFKTNDVDVITKISHNDFMCWLLVSELFYPWRRGGTPFHTLILPFQIIQNHQEKNPCFIPYQYIEKNIFSLTSNSYSRSKHTFTPVFFKAGINCRYSSTNQVIDKQGWSISLTCLIYHTALNRSNEGRLQGQLFDDTDEVKVAVQTWFFRNRIRKLGSTMGQIHRLQWRICWIVPMYTGETVTF